MATYLLLRNNKNSGPYTLEALLQLGLKPYDLVWVEGKSAAWRYPSEVADLKFYAPVVEEQPYDRFYKKPSDNKVQQEAKLPVTETQEPLQPVIAYLAPEEVKQAVKVTEVKSGRRPVFVSLPANTGNTLVKKTESGSTSENQLQLDKTSSVKAAEINEPLSYSALVSDYNNYQPQQKKIANVDGEVQPPVAETKYAQSLDDIKDIYVQTLADRKRKNAQRKMVLLFIKRGLPFAAVLILGFVLGGFLMNRKPAALKVIAAAPAGTEKSLSGKDDLKIRQQPAVVPAVNLPAQQPVTNTDASAKNGDVVLQPSLSDANPPSKKATTQIPLNVVKKFVAKQNELTKTSNNNSSVVQQSPVSIEADPKTGERNKIVRTGTEANSTAGNSPVSAPANGLLKHVNVKGNEYKVGTFGGIHDLQLTVVNSSNFLLDRVTVELQYLKPSQQALKTNTVQFDNVPPNGSLTLAIPPTNRGIKVIYKVVNVQSKAAGSDTAGL